MKASDINKLWIGDKLISTKTGEIGSFEGLHKSGKLRIKRKDKVFLVSHEHLEHVSDSDEGPSIESFDASSNTSRDKSYGKEIDLHIELLRPDLVNALTERIVDIQIKEFEAFLDNAKKQKYKTLTAIHGKGAGVLKNHIHQILKYDKHVFQFNLVNNGGATEIWLY